MYRQNLAMSKDACEPCKPKKVPVFKMNDVVENIYSGEVFRVKVILQSENEILYGQRFPYETRNIHEFMAHGQNLKKFTGKKQ
jgi:hypothetical protein